MVASSSRRSSPSPRLLLPPSLTGIVHSSFSTIHHHSCKTRRFSSSFFPFLFLLLLPLVCTVLHYVNLVDEFDTHMHVIAGGRVMVNGRAGLRRRDRVE